MKLYYCESFWLNTEPVSTLCWRGMTEDSLSLICHITQSETQQQWLIHTVGTLFLFFCTSSLSPTPFLDSTASFKLPCVSASMLRCLLKSVPLSQCVSVSLHIHVSLHLFLLFIVRMWFYVFVFSCTEGLLHRTIWEVILSNGLQKDRPFQEILALGLINCCISVFNSL